jgi:hypothetical protein
VPPAVPLHSGIENDSANQLSLGHREYAMQDNLERLIRARAHQHWEQEGRPEGRAEDHWFEARKLVESTKRPAAKAAPAPKAKTRKKAN